jgi:tetratricopeptide (TPR) repeat protein
MNVRLRGETKYLSLVEEGAALFGNKEYALALTCLWKAFRLRPAAPIVLFNIARTMEELNDPKAEDSYAAAASQGNVDAFYQLATFCLRHGRKGEAVEHLKAFKSNPANDTCTIWARDTLHQLCPAPELVWSRGAMIPRHWEGDETVATKAETERGNA